MLPVPSPAPTLGHSPADLFRQLVSASGRGEFQAVIDACAAPETIEGLAENTHMHWGERYPVAQVIDVIARIRPDTRKQRVFAHFSEFVCRSAASAAPEALSELIVCASRHGFDILKPTQVLLEYMLGSACFFGDPKDYGRVLFPRRGAKVDVETTREQLLEIVSEDLLDNENCRRVFIQEVLARFPNSPLRRYYIFRCLRLEQEAAHEEQSLGLATADVNLKIEFAILSALRGQSQDSSVIRLAQSLAEMRPENAVLCLSLILEDPNNRRNLPSNLGNLILHFIRNLDGCSTAELSVTLERLGYKLGKAPSSLVRPDEVARAFEQKAWSCLTRACKHPDPYALFSAERERIVLLTAIFDFSSELFYSPVETIRRTWSVFCSQSPRESLLRYPEETFQLVGRIGEHRPPAGMLTSPAEQNAYFPGHQEILRNVVEQLSGKPGSLRKMRAADLFGVLLGLSALIWREGEAKSQYADMLPALWQMCEPRVLRFPESRHAENLKIVFHKLYWMFGLSIPETMSSDRMQPIDRAWSQSSPPPSVRSSLQERQFLDLVQGQFTAPGVPRRIEDASRGRNFQLEARTHAQAFGHKVDVLLRLSEESQESSPPSYIALDLTGDRYHTRRWPAVDGSVCTTEVALDALRDAYFTAHHLPTCRVRVPELERMLERPRVLIERLQTVLAEHQGWNFVLGSLLSSTK